MTTLDKVRLAAAISVLLGGVIAVDGQASESAPAGIARQTLMVQPLPPQGPALEARVIRVQFQPGYKTPLHTHEGPGPRYVVKGRLRVEDGGQSKVYGPGEVFWESGAEMTVECVSGSDAEMVIFEVAPRH